MRFLDLTLPSPALNLACDEALLDACEGGLAPEVLRFWEPAQHFVVVGYGNSVATEVNVPFCQLNNIPVLRRCTGGGTVLQGPGVLNYSLILRIASATALQSISTTNRFVLTRIQQSLAVILSEPVEICGHTDLALGGLKFSGNAQRRRKHCLIFHGSFLLNLDINLLEQTLPLPARQPEYRAERSHAAFLTNLKLPAHTIKSALLKCWNASVPLAQVPFSEIKRLAREKYELDEWNLKF